MQQPSEPMDDEVTQIIRPKAGMRFAEFVFDRQIGEGAASEVWLAHDFFGERAAIKIVTRSEDRQFEDRHYARRLLIEGETMLNLHHPNILHVKRTGMDIHWYYMIMAYVTGGTVASALERKGRMPLHQALAVTNNVLHALEYAHARGIVHRDIKPQNILLDPPAGRVLLADFGILYRQRKASDRMTLPGKVLGTAAYMAPEQVRGRDLDARTDLYAVGCMLYEMLYGQPPFGKKYGDDLAIARRQVSEPVVFPATPALSHQLQAVIGRVLEKEPAKRYQHAAAFRRALAPFYTVFPQKGDR